VPVTATAAGAVTKVSITSVTMTGTVDNPLLTVVGSGFGAVQPRSHQPGPCPNRGTGASFGTKFNFEDFTNEWEAGFGGRVLGDCIGIVVDSWTDTTIQFGFGSSYGSVGSWVTAPSDLWEVNVLGAAYASGGGQPANALCKKIRGTDIGNVVTLHLSNCTPHSVSDKQATGDLVNLTWTPSGDTTTSDVTVVARIGASCAHGTFAFWVSGTVTGGSSAYTQTGDPVAADLCLNTTTGAIANSAGTQVAL
jgi:hypothetical protein